MGELEKISKKWKNCPICKNNETDKCFDCIEFYTYAYQRTTCNTGYSDTPIPMYYHKNYELKVGD